MPFRTFVKTACCFLLLPGIFGCAAVGVGKIEELPSTHRVAIVSALGGNLTVQTTGTTIFQNWERMEDVPEWKVDEHVERIVYEKLQRAGKFQLIKIEVSEIRDVLGRVETEVWSGGPKLEGGSDVLRDLGVMGDADSVLLVGNVRMEDHYFGTNQYFEGYGILQRSFLGTKRGINFAAVNVWLIDVRSGNDFARSAATVSSPRSSSEWMSKTSQLSAEGLERTRIQLESLLDAAATKALKNLTLIGGEEER